MIYLITGKTGTGKSFLSTKLILQSIGERKVFTNIKFKDNVEIDNYYYMETEDIFDLVRDIADKCSSMGLEELKAYYRETEYFGSDIFIDEFQYFGARSYDKKFSDLMTIHRHLNMNIYIITQVVSNLHKVYRDLVHVHYQAKSSKKISSQLEYIKRDGCDGDFLGLVFVDPKKYIDVYQSGEVEKTVSNMEKYKLIGVVLALLFAGYYIYGSADTLLHPEKGSKYLSEQFGSPVTSKDTNTTDNNISIRTVVKDGYFTKPIENAVCLPPDGKRMLYYCVYSSKELPPPGTAPRDLPPGSPPSNSPRDLPPVTPPGISPQ